MGNNEVKLVKESVTRETGAVKNDLGKLRYDLIPTYPIEELAKVLTYGAKKYSDRNWEKGFPYGDLYAAILRHLQLWYSGQDLDEESGISHLSHVFCNVAFLLEITRTHPELDNRVKWKGNNDK